MDFIGDGNSESLIPSLQETQAKTAQRTRNLLVATRLAFVFSHGALIMSVSVAVGWEVEASWWAIFAPAWLGDVCCAVLIIVSWFASCPYIQLCLSVRQARHGDSNPSILTELLPDIVLGILGLFALIWVFVAEIMLCWCLDKRQRGEAHNLLPSGVVLLVASTLGFCRGVCIKTDGNVYNMLGGGILVTIILALCVPDGPFRRESWVVLLPLPISAAGLLVVAIRRLHRCKMVLSREERILRVVEQVLLSGVCCAFVMVVYLLKEGQCSVQMPCSFAGIWGVVAGGSMCAVAALRGRMAWVETRSSSVRERLIVWQATGEEMVNRPVADEGREWPLV